MSSDLLFKNREKRETQSYRKIHVSSLTPLLFMYSSALRH